MALFGSKKENKDENRIVETKTSTLSSLPSFKSLLVRPRFTEKATLGTDNSVYTFVVGEKASKDEIRKEIIKKFGKTPTAIRTISLPSKKRRQGVKSGVKKALVTFKKGESIDFV